MTVHSTRLGSAIALGTGDTTIYTCPTGKRTIIKGVQVQNLGGAAARFTLKVYSGATQIMQYAVSLGAVASATDSDTRQIWLVMNAGETIKVSASAGTMTCAVSGAELTL